MAKKNDDARTAGLIGGFAGPIAGGAYGAAKAKKGRKAAVGARVGGRGYAEGTAGAVPGLGLYGAGALAASRGNGKVALPLMIGGGVASLAGAHAGLYHGSKRAFQNAQRRGDIKKSQGMSLVELSKAFPPIMPSARRAAAAAKAAKRAANMESIASNKATSSVMASMKDARRSARDRNMYGAAIADVNTASRRAGLGQMYGMN